MSCVRSLWGKRNNLSFRLTRTYALLFAVTMALFSLIIYFVSWHFLFDRREQELLSSAEHIMEVYYEEISEGHDPLEPELLWELSPSDSMSLLILSPSRQTLSEAANADVDISEIPFCSQSTALYTQSNGFSFLAWEKEIVLDGSAIGTMAFLLDANREYAFLKMLSWLLLLINLGGGAAALVIGWITSRRMLTPLSAVIRRAVLICHHRLFLPCAIGVRQTIM